MNRENIKIFFKKFWKKITIFFTVLVAIFGVMDYLTKWGVIFFLKNYILNILSFIMQNFINILFFLWLLIITIFLVKTKSKKLGLEDRKPGMEEIKKELLVIIKSEILANTKGLLDNFRNQISSINSKIESIQGEVTDLKRTVLDFEITRFLSKGQIGAIGCMIEKLEIDIKRGWGAEDTLCDIKEYIKNKGMPNTYLADLNKSLSRVPEGLWVLKEEISNLIKEKLYKI